MSTTSVNFTEVVFSLVPDLGQVLGEISCFGVINGCPASKMKKPTEISMGFTNIYEIIVRSLRAV